MRKYIVGCLVVCGFVAAAPLQAQEGCTADTGLTNAELLANVRSVCCSKKSAKAKDKCVKQELRKLSRAEDAYGEDFTNAVKADLGALIAAACEEVTASAQCITTDDVETNVSTACCAISNQGKRTSCFNSNSRKTYQTKKSAGRDFAVTVKSGIKELKSNNCGEPNRGSSLKCNRNLTAHDGGLDGFLHKPSGDHTSEVVVLLPDNVGTASACSYHRLDTGKEIGSFHYTGRANGNRQHWRPNGNGSCSALNKAAKNKGIVFRCRIGSQFYCWGNKAGDKMKDACDRQD